EVLDQRLVGPTGQRLRAEGLGPPAGWISEVAAEESDHRIRDVELVRGLGELLRCDTGSYEVECEVPDDLRRGGDLDAVAEDRVGGSVHLLDILQPLPQAQCHGLLAQVRQLPPGDLVTVDATGGAGQTGF